MLKNGLNGDWNIDFIKKIPFEKISTQEFISAVNDSKKLEFYDLSEVEFTPNMIKKPWFCDLRSCTNINPHELIKMQNLEGLNILTADFTGISFKGVSIRWMDLRNCKLTPEQVIEASDITYAQLPEMILVDTN